MTNMQLEAEVPRHERQEPKAAPLIRVERITPDDPRFKEAQRLEYEVFFGENYAEEQADQRLVEYAAYDQASIFNVAYNEAGEMIGVLREIRNTTDESWSETTETTGYKTLDDFSLYLDWQRHFEGCSPQAVVEAGTVAVPKQYRRSSIHVAAHLYHQLYSSAMRGGRTNLIASIDKKLLQIYRYLFNFQDIGPTIADYMGSDTTPVVSDLNELADHLSSKEDKSYYKMVIQGVFS